MKQPPIIMLGTYHKTGTVWLKRVAQDAANMLGWTFIDGARETPSEAFKAPAILFDQDSRFAPEYYQMGRLFGFRMIRDMRDVVISGAHYHLKSTEAWLDDPQDYYGGQSYRQLLQGAGTLRQLYELEMRHIASYTWSQISGRSTKLNARSKRSLPYVHYEDLVKDPEQTELEKVLQKRRIPFKAHSAFRHAFENNSLFSTGYKDKHIRSGEPKQWETLYDQKLARAFARHFPLALIRTGYSYNPLWWSSLPKENTALDSPL